MKGSARRGTVVVVFTLVSLAAFAPKPSRRSIAEATPNSIEPAKAGRSGQAPMVESYGKVPLSFEANRGQTDPRVKFLSRGSGYTLFLTGDEAVLSLRSQESGAALSEAKGVRSQKQEGRPWSLVPSHLQRPTDRAQVTKDKEPGTNDVLRMKLVGANQAAKLTALDELPGKSNYFIGNDPKKWRTDVPTYGKVKYEGVYPGIDLVYYGNQRQLEYDFVVAPGADPKAITLAVGAGLSGHDIPVQAGLPRHNHSGGAKPPLRIDASGDLVVEAEGGEVCFHRPVVYQPTADAANPKAKIQNRKLLDGRYILTADNRVTFEVASYDHGKPLVIDPVLLYSTYLGGSAGDEGQGIAVDALGSAYVTGYTGSTDFPTANAFQPSSPCAGGTTNPCGPAFVAKLNAAGTGLVYSTYLGGSRGYLGLGNQGRGIAVDSSGSAYVTGATDSTDFPITSDAFQTANRGGVDAFVTKLNALGNGLVFSTYLGGSGDDFGFGIAVDSPGNAYVTGYTHSTDFPATGGAFQAAFVGDDAFVTKLNAAGSGLVYSSQFGGGNGAADVGNNFGSGIVVDSSGNAYVAGSTDSADFPTTSGAFQTADATAATGLYKAFVTKLNAAGSGLVYSTYLGGNGGDQGLGIALDSSGNAYVTGGTNSIDFPTTSGAFQTTNGGGYDAFVTKLNAAGGGLVYSTYLGGSGGDVGLGIAVDSSGSAYVTGETISTDFPVTSGAFGTASGGWDAFVTKLNTVGGALVYSTYLGGSNNIWGYAIALDPSGSAYVAGTTDSADFPTTPGAFQTAVGLNNNFNAFVAKIGGVVADPDLAIRLWGAPRTGSRSHLHYAITVENNGPDDASAVTVIDTLPNGTIFLSATPTQGSCTTPAVGGAGTVTCNLGAVTAGGKVSIRLAVHVTAPRGSAISNTATVSGNVSDTNTANNSSTATTSVM